MVGSVKSLPSSPVTRLPDQGIALSDALGADRTSMVGNVTSNLPSSATKSPAPPHPHAAADRAAFYRRVGSQPDTPEMEHLHALLQRLHNTARNIAGLVASINRAAEVNEPATTNQPGATAAASAENKHVDVRLGRGIEAKVHRLEANYVDIADNPDTDTPTRYLAGRAPVEIDTVRLDSNTRSKLFLEHDKALVQAIESGQGMFQFVWAKTHLATEFPTERSIFTVLNVAMQEAQQKGKHLFIGDRYHVEEITKVPAKELAEGTDYFHYQLTVVDQDTGKRSTIPMTQAGISLVNGRLDPDQIIRSHKILESHRELLPLEVRAAQPTAAPLIISNKGRIRNATLIAFTSVYKRIYNLSINTPEEIDEAIHQAVSAGYEARGVRNFIPSRTQIAMLRAALIKGLKDRPMPEAPTAEDLTQIMQAVIPPTIRSEKARSFSAMAFALRDNRGGGNCLFHSLAGTRSEPTLPDSSSALRDEIAAYLEGLPDTTQRSRNNWHSISIALLQKSTSHHTEFVARHPMDKDKVLSNRDFAMYVRVLGLFCGNDEIQLWLDLPRNVNRTVTLIDGQYGQEQITHFQHRIPSKTFRVIDIPGGEAEVRRKVGQAIAAAVNDEQNPACEVPVHLAIYRSNMHFQRIVGQHNMEEQAENVRRARAKIAELEKLSKNMTEEDIAKLGT